MRPIDTARLAYRISRTEGAGWLAFRMKYAARKRLGIVSRRLPSQSWDEIRLEDLLVDAALSNVDQFLVRWREQADRFPFAQEGGAQEFLQRFDDSSDDVVRLANEVVEGTIRLFARTPVAIGEAPAWHRNVLSGVEAPINQHWSRINDFNHGDIKVIWDVSRFGFTYCLVRAYARTGDERYARRFWVLVERWLEKNPPQLGPNWKCGQEASVRLMAWTFGLHGFIHSPETTAARIELLVKACAVFGRRIEENIAYALSQSNNHGMSEAMGLWTIGALFPELRGASRWKAQGKRLLEQEGRKLIYADGSFSQHSLNYHRLMLHDYLWSVRLGDVLGEPFSDELRAMLGRSADFLYQLQDEHTGKLPCYGQNDGSLILRLSNCDYQDFRPVIQATRYLAYGTRTYELGAWDEELWWLFGANALEAPLQAPQQTDLVAKEGGYFTFRGEDGFGFTRCATFQHRPGEADALHVDVWWRGMNIATDAGTYSYNKTEPWTERFNVLSETQFHNTVTVDGLSQMDRATPFLWLPWLKGKIHANKRSADGLLAYWEGEHDGYARLDDSVTHRRAVVQMDGNRWLVLDKVTGAVPHDYRLHWLLADLPHDVIAEQGRGHGVDLMSQHGPYAVRVGSSAVGEAATVVRADSSSPRGWRSPYYMDREPAVSMALVRHGTEVWFWSVLSPGGVEVDVSSNSIVCNGDGWEASVGLRGVDTLISSATLHVGAQTAELRLDTGR